MRDDESQNDSPTESNLVGYCLESRIHPYDSKPLLLIPERKEIYDINIKKGMKVFL